MKASLLDSVGLSALLVLGLVTGAAAQAASQDSSRAGARRPPNVLFILVDDLGWQDVGYMGSSYYKTPHIDSLSKRGTVFTDAYANAPNCTPSRAALMSGQWGARTGIYTVGTSERGPAAARKLVPTPNVEVLDPAFVTLAEMFHANGYATGHFGKWHLGDPGFAGPQEQGFDVNIGGDSRGSPQPGGYFSPYHPARAKPLPGLEDAPPGEYLTDRLTDEAVRFITAHKDRPFFAYLSHYSVHTPLEAKPGTDAPWRAVPPEKRQGVPTYAAMIQSVDDSTGRLMSTLAQLRLLDDTIIVFASDNGGFVGATYAPSLRGSKGMLYEGGIRVPLIVAAPKGARGASVDTPVQLFDLFPTLARLADLQLPETARLDGRDVSKAVITGQPESLQPLFWHLPVYLEASRPFAGSPEKPDPLWRARPSAAIRDGDWKLIENFEDGQLELFNLRQDRAESTNRAERNKDVAKRLFDALHAWLKATHAPVPSTPNPAYDPAYKPGDTGKRTLSED